MNVAIILAAGNSTRFQSKTPKVLLGLKGKPVLRWSLEVFAKHPRIDAIIVVAPGSYLSEIEKLLESPQKLKGVVEGGCERYQSVYKALEFCHKNFEHVDNVFIHDGARPLIDIGMIDGLLDALNNNPAATLAIPAWELVVKATIGDEPHITEFPDRRCMYLVQTPQGFHFEKLYAAHKKYDKLKPNLNIYDDCGLFQWAFPQEKASIVEGSRQNIKITHPCDIGIVESFIEIKNS